MPLGAEDVENLQELDVQDFEQQLVGEQGMSPSLYDQYGQGSLALLSC
jgi:hypothetical protein